MYIANVCIQCKCGVLNAWIFLVNSKMCLLGRVCNSVWIFHFFLLSFCLLIGINGLWSANYQLIQTQIPTPIDDVSIASIAIVCLFRYFGREQKEHIFLLFRFKQSSFSIVRRRLEWPIFYHRLLSSHGEYQKKKTKSPFLLHRFQLALGWNWT